MLKNHENTTREILLLKERFGVCDDDPVFLFLQAYGKMVENLLNAINETNELKTNLLEINSIVKDMPNFVIDELRGEISFIREEINKLEPDIRSVQINNRKYSSSIVSLAADAKSFSKTMKTIKSSHWLLYIGVGSVVVLQILNLLINLKVF